MPAASQSGVLGACAVVVRLVGLVAVGAFNLAAQGVLQGFLRGTNLYSGGAKSIRRCAGRSDARKLVRGSLSGPQYLILHQNQRDNLV
jgi:hypothetical protein